MVVVRKHACFATRKVKVLGKVMWYYAGLSLIVR